MDLKEHFADSEVGLPADDESGVESEWLDLCTMAVPSGSIWVGDPLFAWAEAQSSDGCLVEVPPGDYVVQAKALDFSNSKIVSRLRVLRVGCTSATLGAEVGEAGTDSAMLAVADQNALKRAFETVCANEYEACQGLVQEATSRPPGVLRPDPTADGLMAFVPSGSDGSGPVLELLSGGSRVGIESEVYPVPIRLRCPIETCAGYVVGDSVNTWCCEECGYEWDEREELNEAVSEIIDKYAHRQACYVKNGDNWDPVPVDQEPEDYQDLVEGELEDE